MTIALVSDVKDRRLNDQAGIIIRGIVDDLDAIDYTKYYSSVKKRGSNTGTEQKAFSDFSVRAVRAVKVSWTAGCLSSCWVAAWIGVGLVEEGMTHHVQAGG